MLYFVRDKIGPDTGAAVSTSPRHLELPGQEGEQPGSVHLVVAGSYQRFAITTGSRFTD